MLGGVHCGIYKGSFNVSDISYLNLMVKNLNGQVIQVKSRLVSYTHTHTHTFTHILLYIILNGS
jgi:hypothetical protein